MWNVRVQMIGCLLAEGWWWRGQGRKTWEQCVRDDMKLLGLHSEWAFLGICGGT